VTHKQFATLLSGWRKENDFTQQEAADRMGVPRRSLENWEQERAMPQGFGLGAILRVIAGDDRAPVPGKSARRRERASRKPVTEDLPSAGTALDTHLL